MAAFTNRPACAACGTAKRHYFDRVAIEQGFPVLATGHNLDDEAARLMGNVMRWQVDHLAKQSPVLESTHARFVRKVKPLFRVSEYETAVYAFFRGIDYIIDECPNSVGATQLLYKDALNRLEAAMPGTKLSFVQEFLRSGRPAFATATASPPQTCERCGMPAFGTVCSFCSLVREVETKQARRAARQRDRRQSVRPPHSDRKARLWSDPTAPDCAPATPSCSSIARSASTCARYGRGRACTFAAARCRPTISSDSTKDASSTTPRRSRF